jgi:signal transduction histidine kinase
MEHTVLFVDDEQNVLNSLERLFEDEGYEVVTASSGNEALQKLDSKKVSLVISDYRMPLMNGMELLQQVKTKAPEAMRIMLTGFADMEATIDSINKSGVYRYVTKPWNDEELKIIVRDSLRQYELAEENKRLNELTRKQNQELKDLNENLEKRVEERTQEIKVKNRELEKLCSDLNLQTKKALEASRLKSEFLANISHEIRTPLNAIMGFGQLLDDDLEDPLSDKQGEFLGYILSSGENLLNVINDILDLSKIEAERLTLENFECPLREIIDELYKMLSQKADEKGIELKISYGKDISDKILSDPTRLRQILLNLIGNAIKFTDKGYVEIGIQKGSNFPEHLEFYVRDTGIGIPQEKIESIFNPFEQVDGSMTRKYGGTGLGLAIVSRLIGLMGGEIKVVSQSGKGSTFYFEIPYKPVQERAEKPVKVKEADAPQVPSSDIKKCILVAENDGLIYRLIETILTKKGFDLLRAENGEDAISVCKTKRNEIDLILIDEEMPLLGGFKATKVMKKYSGEIPIIAITADAVKGDRQRFLEAGCTDHISKPLKPSGLLEKIEQCIK